MAKKDKLQAVTTTDEILVGILDTLEEIRDRLDQKSVKQDNQPDQNKQPSKNTAKGKNK